MSNMGNMARETAKDARHVVKETGKVASAAPRIFRKIWMRCATTLRA